MTSLSSGVFERSGLAARSDLQDPEWRAVFSALEAEQKEFLSFEKDFRSPEYAWPRDPLHNWSRVWEYPYAYHHLQMWRRSRPQSPLLKVADVGSGVTFFPFSVARLGCEVICTDIDPICETDLGRAARLVPAEPGRIECRITDGRTLPYADGEVDAAYSISVIEHIPEFAGTIKEIHRALKPGGLFLLTCDVATAATEYDSLGIAAFARLRRALEEFFVPALPEKSVHPEDVLRVDNSPRLGPPPAAIPGWGTRILRAGWRVPAHPVRSVRRARELLFPVRFEVPRLSVIAFCLRKRSGDAAGSREG